MEAFRTVIKSPWKDSVSMALAIDVGGFSALGGFEQPDTPTIR